MSLLVGLGHRPLLERGVLALEVGDPPLPGPPSAPAPSEQARPDDAERDGHRTEHGCGEDHLHLGERERAAEQREGLTSAVPADQFSAAKSTTSPAAKSPSRMSAMPIGHLPSQR